MEKKTGNLKKAKEAEVETLEYPEQGATKEEEADESLYWLEILAESEIVSANKLSALMKDIDEIVAMTVSSIKTLRTKNLTNPKSKI